MLSLTILALKKSMKKGNISMKSINKTKRNIVICVSIGVLLLLSMIFWDRLSLLPYLLTYKTEVRHRTLVSETEFASHKDLIKQLSGFTKKYADEIMKTEHKTARINRFKESGKTIYSLIGYIDFENEEFLDYELPDSDAKIIAGFDRTFYALNSISLRDDLTIFVALDDAFYLVNDKEDQQGKIRRAFAEEAKTNTIYIHKIADEWYTVTATDEDSFDW
jgi:hypothetical protein